MSLSKSHFPATEFTKQIYNKALVNPCFTAYYNHFEFPEKICEILTFRMLRFDKETCFKNKGVSFQRNCGTTLVGEFNRLILCYQLS